MWQRSIFPALAISLVSIVPALAWGPEGHQEVGAIADKLLSGPAAEKLKSKVGFTLEQSGPWLDCVKSVHNNGGVFSLFDDPDHKSYLHPQCEPFFVKAPAEQKRMEDYVRRNWDSCRNEGGIDIGADKSCSDVYHYTDVSITHDQYQLGDAGTSDLDVVSAIDAAIAFLQGIRDPSSKIMILDDKEAVLMLAHLVGDLHQPLHVGAIYLDADGRQVDPDAGHYDRATGTQGGNLIEHLTRDGRHRSYHSEWDGFPRDAKFKIDDTDIAAAKAILKSDTSSDHDAALLDKWAASWASDSLRQGATAFEGAVFASRLPVTAFDGSVSLRWPLTFENEVATQARNESLAREAIRKAGARLALILNTIWKQADPRSLQAELQADENVHSTMIPLAGDVDEAIRIVDAILTRAAQFPDECRRAPGIVVSDIIGDLLEIVFRLAGKFKVMPILRPCLPSHCAWPRVDLSHRWQVSFGQRRHR